MKTDGMKTCRRCHTTKPLEDYYLRAGRAGRPKRRETICKACNLAAQKKYKSTDRGAEVGWALNLKKYGMTPESYAALLHAQGGVCAICRKPERTLGKRGKIIRLAVDHCHESRRIRGLLCVTCNTALGKLGDEPVLATRAALYLMEHAKEAKHEANSSD